MKENSKKEPLKRKKILVKEEEKRYSLFDNNKREISQKEYNYRAKNCFFFMRSPLSNHLILEIKPDSKKKKKKKRKQRQYFYLQFKSEKKVNNNKSNSLSINNNQIRNQNIEEKNSYINLQPRKTWINCKKIYNKCLKGYNPEEHNKESMFDKFMLQRPLIENKNYNSALKNEIDSLPLLDKPIINYSKNRIKKKQLHTINLGKNKLLFKSINLNLKFNPRHENNFLKCMNKTMNSNFINKGINEILENKNFGNIKALKELKLDKNKEVNENKKKKKIQLAYRFERKRLSLLNASLPKLDMAKKMGISLEFQYKINSFFYSGKKGINFSEDEEEDLEIIADKGNFVIKNSVNKKENSDDNLENNQSKFNFFCLKNLFRLEQFHIFGLISSEGEESEKCSRLLKKILVDKLSNEKNYINEEVLEKNQFKQKIDYILFIFLMDKFNFISKLFNSLENELKNMGINIETTGASFSLIFFIKDKIISTKIGNVHPFFIYDILDEKINNNLIIRNPHYEHNLNNIFEQDRLEENKCVIKTTKNKLGKNDFKIEYKYNNEIQNLLNYDNIQCTRMIGYNKLRKIGIINKPEIQTFSMDIYKYQKENLDFEQKNKNPHSSDNDFCASIKKKGINFSDLILKFVIIGNDELFNIMKNSYYIKEIHEAMKKDEIAKKNKDNIKYSFNLKQTIKKLVDDSMLMNNIFMSKENIKELGLALVTLVES